MLLDAYLIQSIANIMIEHLMKKQQKYKSEKTQP